MVKSVDTPNQHHLMTSASDKNKHKEKILEIPDTTYHGFQDSHHRLDQALVSDPSIFGSQQTVQAPSASTTKFPITQNHHFACGGGESGKRVIYASNPTSIRERTKVPLSYFTTRTGPRVSWTKELHDRFVEVMSELGGPNKVTPETLRQAMAVEGLTRVHLKSRLQKFRNGKITVTNWREHQSSNKSRRKNIPLQRELHQQLQTAEVNLDDQNVDTEILRPTQRESYFEIYNSLEKCLRTENDVSSAASNGNLPNHQVVNPPDHSAVNGVFGDIASLQVPETATTDTVQTPNAIASSPSCAAKFCLPISNANATSSCAAYGPTSNENSKASTALSCTATKLPTSKGGFSPTAYLDEYMAALDAFKKNMRGIASEVALMNRLISDMDVSDSPDFNKTFKYPGVPSDERR